jgi:hypothetical protein
MDIGDFEAGRIIRCLAESHSAQKGDQAGECECSNHTAISFDAKDYALEAAASNAVS